MLSAASVGPRGARLIPLMFKGLMKEEAKGVEETEGDTEATEGETEVTEGETAARGED